MAKKPPTSDVTGPMRMQPIEHGPTAPTQMLPLMPCANAEKEETKVSTPETKRRTRTEAVRKALAKITRRKSLRKQRATQKS
jgi:hypothetical protein